jgi:predicted nucleic acid-binding protein
LGKHVYSVARTLFPTVLPITAAVMDQARDFVSAHPNLSARDAVHAAVVRVYNLEGICTFDLDFDTIPSITRIIP